MWTKVLEHLIITWELLGHQAFSMSVFVQMLMSEEVWRYAVIESAELW